MSNKSFSDRLDQVLSERVSHVLDIVGNRQKVTQAMVALDKVVHAFDAAIKTKDVGQIEGILNQLPGPLKNFDHYVNQVKTKQGILTGQQPQQAQQPQQPVQQQTQQPQTQQQVQPVSPDQRGVMTPEAETQFADKVVADMQSKQTPIERRVALLRGYAEYLQAGGKMQADQFRQLVRSKLPNAMTSSQRSAAVPAAQYRSPNPPREPNYSAYGATT